LREIQLLFLPNLKPNFPSHVTFRSILWIGLGVAVWIVLDSVALKTELSGQINGLVNELNSTTIQETTIVGDFEISASRSSLLFGKKVGKISIQLVQETDEGMQLATRYYYFEKVGDNWSQLGTLQYL
jgi:hypothetical protein